MIKTPHRESSITLSQRRLGEKPLTDSKQQNLHSDRVKVIRGVAGQRVLGFSLALLYSTTFFSFQNTFKAQNQLEYLDLSHNGFEKIQPTFFNTLGRLLWLNVSNNALTEMSGRNFARNSLLRVLHMNHNKITRLDSNSFRGMRFMRRLYFSDNQITDVGRGTFRAVNR